jgi:hypothetical protein
MLGGLQRFARRPGTAFLEADIPANWVSVRTISPKNGKNPPRMPLFRPFGMLNEITT